MKVLGVGSGGGNAIDEGGKNRRGEKTCIDVAHH